MIVDRSANNSVMGGTTLSNFTATRPTHRRATSEVTEYLTNNMTYDINIIDRSGNNSVMGGTTLSNFSETEDLNPFGSRRNSKTIFNNGKSKAIKYVKIPK